MIRTAAAARRGRAALAGVPLRLRLVAALTALVALALAISGFAAGAALRGYLVDRVDANLAAAVGRPGPRGRLLRDPDDTPRRPGEYAVQVFAADGTLVRPFAAGATVPPRVTAADAARLVGRPATLPAAAGPGSWRVLAVPAGPAGTVVLAASLADVDATVRRLVLLELAVGGAVVVGLAVLGDALVRSSLRPLVTAERTAEAIAAGDLTRRVPAPDPRTEVGRLAAALNAMLGQIERAFRDREESAAQARATAHRMRRFVADAGHELRTPLTSIRGFAELYRQGAVGGPGELDRVMRRVEDEATRMGLLVEDLLLLARLDQSRPLAQEPVDLRAVVADAVEDARLRDPQRPVQLLVEPAPAVRGDEARLRQVVGNLVANALTHTPAGTPVTVRLGGRAGQAVVEVRDEGPGLAPEQAARVFERFYRVDPARTRGTGGSGLGLSIVAALVAAHGGRVEVDTAPGAGATFRVLLPAGS